MLRQLRDDDRRRQYSAEVKFKVAIVARYRLTTRNLEGTAITGFSQNQKVQEWREAPTASDRTFFAQGAGDLLIELGYENKITPGYPSADLVEFLVS